MLQKERKNGKSVKTKLAAYEFTYFGSLKKKEEERKKRKKRYHM